MNNTTKTINRSLLNKVLNTIKINAFTLKAINLALNSIIKESTVLNKISWFTYAHKLKTWLNSAIDSDTLPFTPFTLGNEKLPFLSWSTAPGINCPGAGLCWNNGRGYCYSLKAWRYPAAFFRQLQNTILENTHFGRAIILQHLDRLQDLPKFKKLDHITLRLFVDGDFSSLENLKFWLDAIKARPKLKVYGYSKSLLFFKQLNESGYKWPKNYVLNGSSGSKYENTEIARYVSKLPIYRGEFKTMYVSKETLTAWKTQELKPIHTNELRQKNKKYFICPTKCGDCTKIGHACGNNDVFKDVTIVIPAH